MAKQICTNLNLNKNQILNAVLHPASSAPATPEAGQVYFDNSSSVNQLKVYNGTEWKALSSLTGAIDKTINKITIDDKYLEYVSSWKSDFSTSTAYAIGDIVKYSGTVYICSAAHSAGAWDAAHFVSLGGAESFIGIQINGTDIAVGADKKANIVLDNSLEYNSSKLGVKLSATQGTGVTVTKNSEGLKVVVQDSTTAQKGIVQLTDTYVASDDTKAVDGKAIKAAIDTLKVTNITGFGTDKTLATLVESEGKISATFQAIQTLKGATTSEVGVKGFVPAPAIADKDRFLRGDGTWADIPADALIMNATVNLSARTFTVDKTPTEVLAARNAKRLVLFHVDTGSLYGSIMAEVSQIYTADGTDKGNFDATIPTADGAFVISGTAGASAYTGTLYHRPIQKAISITANTGLNYTAGADYQYATLAGVAFKGSSTSEVGKMGMVPAPLIADKSKFLKGDGTWAEVPSGSLIINVTAITGINPITFLVDKKPSEVMAAFDEKRTAFLFADVSALGMGIISGQVSQINDSEGDCYVNIVDTVGGINVLTLYAQAGDVYEGTYTLRETQKRLAASTGITIDDSADDVDVIKVNIDANTLSVNSEGNIYALTFTGATDSVDGKAGIAPAPLVADRAKYLKGNGTWGQVAANEVSVTAFTGMTATNVQAGLQEVYADEAVTVTETAGTSSEGFIRKYTIAQVGTGTSTAKTLSEDIEIPKLELSKLGSPTTGYAATYELKYDGTALGTKIDIPQDWLLKYAWSNAVTKYNSTAGAKMGDLVIDPSTATSSEGTIYAVKEDVAAGTTWETVRDTKSINSGKTSKVNGKYLCLFMNVKEGTAETSLILIPLKDLGTTYTASAGIKLEGTTFKHNNAAITPQADAKIDAIKYDEYGHILEGNAVTVQGGLELTSDFKLKHTNAITAIDDSEGYHVVAGKYDSEGHLKEYQSSFVAQVKSVTGSIAVGSTSATINIPSIDAARSTLQYMYTRTMIGNDECVTDVSYNASTKQVTVSIARTLDSAVNIVVFYSVA